jgi:RNA polymerase sigma factor for flagellar operon FliA
MNYSSSAVAYENCKSFEEKDVLRYAALVKRIAQRMRYQLPQEVQFEDLIQAGMVGLLEARRQYDAAQGASFETYATIRIRGAIFDEVRNHNWAPRSVYKKARTISEAIRSVEEEYKRDAKPAEIAQRLEMSVEEYHQLLFESSAYVLVSYDESQVEEEEHRDEVYKGIESEKIKSFISASVDTLPEREKNVLSMYYNNEMTLKEIGLVLGVSESRVCQLHSQAVLRLRARVREWS